MNLSQEQEQLRKKFRAFCNQVVKPLAARIDKEERFPPELIEALAGKGYLGANIPEEYGGLGLDQLSYGLLNEELGRVCSSTRSLLTVHASLVAETLLKCGSPQQKEKYLPLLASGKKIASFALTEPETGSDAKNISTSYEYSDGHFILSGTKKWISFAQFSDLMIVIARSKQKENVISAFILDARTEGIEIRPIHGLSGIKASQVAEIHLKECRLPAENLLGKEGAGFFQIANIALDNGRYSVACGSVGIALACLEESQKYIKARKQFGVYLKEHQLIKQKISAMVVGIKAARLLCYHTGFLRNQEEASSIDYGNVSKFFAARLANECARDAVQIQGANGCLEASPVQRFSRDAKIMEIIEGTTEIQQLIISSLAEEELL